MKFVLSAILALTMLISACETRSAKPETKAPAPTKEVDVITLMECAKTCPDVMDPVCGVDGEIYSNACIAECAGMEIEPEGGCAICEKSAEDYQLEGLQKVKSLNEYISVILSNSRDESMLGVVNTAVEEAMKLFVNDQSMVQVLGQMTRSFGIRDYLDRIKSYHYGKVEITWTEIGYTSQLKKGTDGNFYGVITITQKFTGYAEDGVTPVYYDVTEKDIEIVLKTYKQAERGRIEVACEIFLNDIGVKDARTYP